MPVFLKIMVCCQAGLLSFFLSVASYCEEPTNTKPAYSMEEIVVTGSYHEITSEIVIEKELLHTLRANTADEILNNVPGTSITVGAKNSSEIMIRGFSARDVVIMVDGRPVNDPYYGKIDLSTIGLGNVEKLRIVKGPSSVRYGSNAMGGVVNIVTGRFDDGSPVEIQSTAGNGKDFRTDVISRGKAAGVGYRVHFGRNTTHGYPLSGEFNPSLLENGNMRDNSDYHRTDINAKLFFENDASQKWNLGISHSQLNKGLPSSIYEARFWRFKRWDRTAIDLTGEMLLSESFQLKTNIYTEKFINELVDFRDESYDSENIYWDSTHDNRTAGFLVSSSYRPDEKTVSNAGIRFRWDESNRQPDTAAAWYVNRTATTFVFIEQERIIKENLNVRGGLSGHMFNYDSWNKTAFSFNPSFHIDWYWSNYIVTGSVSRVSRFPTLHHLYSQTSGNRGLNPEKAYKSELSITRNLFDSLKITTTGFMSRVHDMIYQSGKLNKYQNIENATMYGAEISEVLSLKRFNIHSDVMLLNARDDDGNHLEYRPKLKIDTYIDFNPAERIRLYLVSRHIGRRWAENGRKMKSYTVADTGISLNGYRHLSFSVKIENIFDVNYEDEYGYPMPGRIFRIGVDWRRDNS